MPDGTIIENVPDSATRKEVLAVYRKILRSRTPEFEKEARRLASETSGERYTKALAGTPAMRFVQGAADLPLGAAQLASRAIPGNAAQDYMDRVISSREEIMQEGRSDRGSEGFDFYRLAGNIGGSVPLGAVKGGATALSRVGTSTAIGGGIGAAAPISDTEKYKVLRDEITSKTPNYIFVHDRLPYDISSSLIKVKEEFVFNVNRNAYQAHPDHPYYGVWQEKFTKKIITSFAGIIEHAKELHLMDSAFFCFATYLDLTKVEKLVVYRRLGTGLNYDLDQYIPEKQHWEVRHI